LFGGLNKKYSFASTGNKKSKIMFLIRLYIFTIFIATILPDYPEDKLIFISPVKIPLLLSANFGELRPDHFHSGVDIKTQGVTGKDIVAAADGYIYRIGVSPGGFGKALYIKHPSGYSTVYAHLEKFVPEIDKFVKAEQYNKKSFTVTLFPPKDKFPVKQGETIAYSGNSGSSGGPHLHYEIRETDGERPVNPLLFDFGTGDNITPVIEKLFIYPVNSNTLINRKNDIKKLNVSGGHGNYFIPSEEEIQISGAGGFGIKAYDLLNDSYNKCAVTSIELAIDSIPIFRYEMDSFSFTESRYINSHIDYETYMRDKIFIQRTYKLPNDKLGAYKQVFNRGIFNFTDNKMHHAVITVKDVHNNKSVLTFNVKAVTEIPKESEIPVDKNFTMMPFNRSNDFTTNKISLRIPGGTLYDTLWFSYRKSPGKREMLSEVHSIHNKYTPVHKPYSLSIKPDTIPAGKESKMLLVQLNGDRKTAVNSKWSDGYITGELSTFGDYYIGIDTVPPVISPNGLVSGINLTGKKELRIKITDDFSGIKSYEPSIDGEWALFEYDPKNNLLVYRFDEERIGKNTKHSFSLKVTDHKENFSYLESDFTW